MVAPSVVDMSYERLAYDDADTAGQMHDDCAECGTRISLPLQRTEAPSLHADDHAFDAAKTQIEVSEAAAYLASRLHLHLD